VAIIPTPVRTPVPELLVPPMATSSSPAEDTGSSSPMGADDPTQVVYFQPQYRVLVCLPCGQKVSPGRSFVSHFRNVHRTKGPELQALIAHAASFSVSEGSTLPPNGASIIPQLLHFNGYSCNDCSYLTTSRDNVLGHCNKCQPSRKDGKWRERSPADVVDG
jgi:Orsellinic acid/F9775 biosynthesis cluster protein D